MAIATEFEAPYVICSGFGKLVQNTVSEVWHNLDLEKNSSGRAVNSKTMRNVKTPYFKQHRAPKRNLVWCLAIAPPSPRRTETPIKLLSLDINRHRRDYVRMRIRVREQTQSGDAEDSKNDDQHYRPMFLIFRQRMFVYCIGSLG